MTSKPVAVSGHETLIRCECGHSSAFTVKPGRKDHRLLWECPGCGGRALLDFLRSGELYKPAMKRFTITELALFLNKVGRPEFEYFFGASIGEVLAFFTEGEHLEIKSAVTITRNR